MRKQTKHFVVKKKAKNNVSAQEQYPDETNITYDELYNWLNETWKEVKEKSKTFKDFKE